jgi:hypothetical protein
MGGEVEREGMRREGRGRALSSTLALHSHSVPLSTPSPPTSHPPQVLMEFPQLTMSLPDGREESIMKRTCLVRGEEGGGRGKLARRARGVDHEAHLPGERGGGGREMEACQTGARSRS